MSYNGGSGGIQARPTPARLVVAREPHVNPLPQQIEHRTQAAQNPAQFAKANGGRPAVLAATQPLKLQQVAAAPGLANPGVREVTARNAAGHPELNRVAPAARPNESAARKSEPAAQTSQAAEPATRPKEPAAVQPNQPAARPNEQHAKPTELQHPTQQAHPELNTEASHSAAKPQPKPHQRPEEDKPE